MTTETNIPAFATTMAAIPKRLRAGLHATQHGRENTMLIPSEQDPNLFVGRLIKTGRRRYRFEAFDIVCPEGEAPNAQVIAEGRVSSPLNGFAQARTHNAAHQAA